MSRMLDTGEVKALFRQLVKRAGGTEACAVELGISHQRVSFLQNASNEDEPSFRQIRALEFVAGADIVTGAASRAVIGEVDDCVSMAAVESVQTAATALRLVHNMEADGVRDVGEIRLVQEATQKNLAEAQELADAAARLKPGAA